MVCGHEARKDLAGVIGLTPAVVTRPTWVDHVYSCAYVYPNGTFVLSVKELDSAAQTMSSFNQLAAVLGRRPDSVALGQEAFITTDGSVVARKDWKVLLIDVSRLPATFGQPAFARSDVATAIGSTIMGCWSGA
jgi:hypothetical protein